MYGASGRTDGVRTYFTQKLLMLFCPLATGRLYVDDRSPDELKAIGSFVPFGRPDGTFGVRTDSSIMVMLLQDVRTDSWCPDGNEIVPFSCISGII